MKRERFRIGLILEIASFSTGLIGDVIIASLTAAWSARLATLFTVMNMSSSACLTNAQH